MNRVWKIGLLVALLLIGAVFTLRFLRSERPQSAKQLPAATSGTNSKVREGDSAPDFQLLAIDGAQVSLATLQGQPAVLVFWTAWCPTCKEEAPRINDLAAKYEPRGVRVLGINIQDSLARTQSGIKDLGIRYRVARDADASIARRFNVTGTPTIVFLDRRGVVQFFSNALPGDYAQRLDALVAAE